jgi:hypothetical protein
MSNHGQQSVTTPLIDAGISQGSGPSALWGSSAHPERVTSNHDSDDLIERFRVALHTVERGPWDEAVGELRLAAAPILDQFRAEYRAAGHTDGDAAALFRWLRAKLTDRESVPNAPRLTRS